MAVDLSFVSALSFCVIKNDLNRNPKFFVVSQYRTNIYMSPVLEILCVDFTLPLNFLSEGCSRFSVM